MLGFMIEQFNEPMQEQHRCRTSHFRGAAKIQVGLFTKSTFASTLAQSLSSRQSKR